jgi:hypothetical protein
MEQELGPKKATGARAFGARAKQTRGGFGAQETKTDGSAQKGRKARYRLRPR